MANAPNIVRLGIQRCKDIEEMFNVLILRNNPPRLRKTNITIPNCIHHEVQTDEVLGFCGEEWSSAEIVGEEVSPHRRENRYKTTCPVSQGKDVKMCR